MGSSTIILLFTLSVLWLGGDQGVMGQGWGDRGGYYADAEISLCGGCSGNCDCRFNTGDPQDTHLGLSMSSSVARINAEASQSGMYYNAEATASPFLGLSSFGRFNRRRRNVDVGADAELSLNLDAIDSVVELLDEVKVDSNGTNISNTTNLSNTTVEAVVGAILDSFHATGPFLNQTTTFFTSLRNRTLRLNVSLEADLGNSLNRVISFLNNNTGFQKTFDDLTRSARHLVNQTIVTVQRLANNSSGNTKTLLSQVVSVLVDSRARLINAAIEYIAKNNGPDTVTGFLGTLKNGTNTIQIPAVKKVLNKIPSSLLPIS